MFKKVILFLVVITVINCINMENTLESFAIKDKIKAAKCVLDGGFKVKDGNVSCCTYEQDQNKSWVNDKDGCFCENGAVAEGHISSGIEDENGVFQPGKRINCIMGRNRDYTSGKKHSEPTGITAIETKIGNETYGLRIACTGKNYKPAYFGKGKGDKIWIKDFPDDYDGKRQIFTKIDGKTCGLRIDNNIVKKKMDWITKKNLGENEKRAYWDCLTGESDDFYIVENENNKPDTVRKKKGNWMIYTKSGYFTTWMKMDLFGESGDFLWTDAPRFCGLQWDSGTKEAKWDCTTDDKKASADNFKLKRDANVKYRKCQDPVFDSQNNLKKYDMIKSKNHNCGLQYTSGSTNQWKEGFSSYNQAKFDCGRGNVGDKIQIIDNKIKSNGGFLNLRDASDLVGITGTGHNRGALHKIKEKTIQPNERNARWSNDKSNRIYFKKVGENQYKIYAKDKLNQFCGLQYGARKKGQGVLKEEKIAKWDCPEIGHQVMGSADVMVLSSKPKPFEPPNDTPPYHNVIRYGNLYLRIYNKIYGNNYRKAGFRYGTISRIRIQRGSGANSDKFRIRTYHDRAWWGLVWKGGRTLPQGRYVASNERDAIWKKNSGDWVKFQKVGNKYMIWSKAAGKWCGLQCASGWHKNAKWDCPIGQALKGGADKFTIECRRNVVERKKHTERMGHKGRSYRGNRNKTRSGYTCQRWNKDWPHKRSGTVKKAHRKGWRGLRHPYHWHNFCRNPDSTNTIWCYTTNPNKRWERCNPYSWYTYNNSCQSA